MPINQTPDIVIESTPQGPNYYTDSGWTTDWYQLGQRAAQREAQTRLTRAQFQAERAELEDQGESGEADELREQSIQAETEEMTRIAESYNRRTALDAQRRVQLGRIRAELENSQYIDIEAALNTLNGYDNNGIKNSFVRGVCNNFSTEFGQPTAEQIFKCADLFINHLNVSTSTFLSPHTRSYVSGESLKNVDIRDLVIRSIYGFYHLNLYTEVINERLHLDAYTAKNLQKKCTKILVDFKDILRELSKRNFPCKKISNILGINGDMSSFRIAPTINTELRTTLINDTKVERLIPLFGKRSSTRLYSVPQYKTQRDSTSTIELRSPYMHGSPVQTKKDFKIRVSLTC